MKLLPVVFLLALVLSLAACKSGITGSLSKEVPKEIPPNSIQVCIGGDRSNCQIIQLNQTNNESAGLTGTSNST